MARIAGVDLPNNKRLEVALTYIYGVGPSLARVILDRSNIPNIYVKELSEDQIMAIREILKDYPIEGDLRKQVSMNIKRLIDIGAYRGSRHKKNLPCRGQRTKTNARTRRGKRKTVGGAGKKEESKG
jgi:small subunit ribosomal protein S13